jgi:tRNA nucleotidyltransferase (CCA-adding enzyme)
MINIPEKIIGIIKKLEKNEFQAFIVGGCVRDLLMKRDPVDWDITTNAKPEDVMKIFPDSFYENDFGTVGVKVKSQKSKVKGLEEKTEVVEVTTYRIESKYSDKRHPDKVKFADTLEEDLSRRDFTINALALKIPTSKSQVQNSPYELIDILNGREDLENKIIKAVGNPDERFDEDALRMMRAVRFASTLNESRKSKVESQKSWVIEKKTLAAIKNNAKNMEHISQERIKDELNKIILSNHPSEGIEMLHETGLLKYIIPELEKGVGVAQNRHHIYTIYNHSILSLKYCPSEKLEVRLAALLHDIAKPQTKRGEGEYATFYNHDHVGARVAEKILNRLRYSNEVIKKVVLLIDNHMFYYNPEEVGDSSVRRLIQKVGLENMKDLMDVRIADRLGSGVPKAKPYKLRHLEYVIEKVSRDAVSVKMLKINGNDLMKELKLKPGPKIGAILEVLLAEVIEDPAKNKKTFLLKRAKELEKEDLGKLRQMAKIKIEEKKEEEDKELKDKHWVK